MKKIIYIFLLALFCACDNVLDVKPENAMTFTNFFQDEEDVNMMTIQLHSFFKYKMFEGETMVYRAIYADKVMDSYVLNYRNLNQSAIIQGGNNWKNHYDLIYVANVILDNVYRAENLPEDRKNFYVGQAYFVKGFAYFDLARKWGECVITKNSTTTDVYAKRPVMEIIDEAIRNAEEAYKILPLYADMRDISGAVWKTKQYGCKGSAAALLAHLYAWKGSVIDLCELEGDAKECYRESIEWASLLIDKKVGNYGLETEPELVCKRTLKGLDELSDESIMEFELDEFTEYPNVYMIGMQYLTWPVDETKLPGSIKDKDWGILSSSVRTMYEEGDKRRDAYFYEFEKWANPDSVHVTGGYAYVNKWREGVYVRYSWSPDLQWDYLRSNYCYWRMADIYLLRAECYAKLGDNMAESDLNEVRDRAGAKLYPAATDTRDIKYAIFKEREKELLLEGHRYYDIVRNGLDYIHEFLDGNFKTLTLQDIKSGALYLPVSSEAFTLNDLMRQNIYWGQFEN
jgi:putative outer membrane protein probably involved in nutrient binding